MKISIVILVLSICTTQILYSQEEDVAVVGFNLPFRNSLTINRTTIHPAFSFVREQSKYISISNKREWTQFEDAPLSYLASYSGKLSEKIGGGISVFQQNYGVLATFGGVLNFAYNIEIASEQNLTFGLNAGMYKSGLNTGNIITNFNDPAIDNIPDSMLITVHPGINYETGYFDFGLSFKNLVLYNLKTSMLIENNPEQGAQAHIMYTGYFTSRGFFDESKFTSLLKSEFRKDETVISGLMMVTVPKGFWVQAGYNTLYGASGGLGLNISKKIAIEYNYEKALGDMTDFGSSHEISIAYRLNNSKSYDHRSDDEVNGLLIGDKKDRERLQKKKVLAKKKAIDKAAKNARILAEQQAKDKDAEDTRILAEQQAKDKDAEDARILAEQQAKDKDAEDARILAEQQAKDKDAEDARILAEQQAKDKDAEDARILAEQQAKDKDAEDARILAEQQAKDKDAEDARILAEQQAKDKDAEDARILAEQQAKDKDAEDARILAEQQAKDKDAEDSRILAEQQAKDKDAEDARILAEQQAKDKDAEDARILAEQQAKDKDAEDARILAEQQGNEFEIVNSTDAISKEMLAISKQAESLKITQDNLLDKYNEIVEIKNNDLQDLKEEYRLSLQGIAVKQKPFKSITAENNTLNEIKSDLVKIIESRNEEINTLKKLYKKNIKRSKTEELDNVNRHYNTAIKRLEIEQSKTLDLKNKLDIKLKDINISTEIERKRRIKRAVFDNEEERYLQDRKSLENIKKTYVQITTTLTSDDFDFGNKQDDEITILQNVKHMESGYYIIIAVHSNINKRDEFITKTMQSGNKNVNFFYDANTSQYYIYHTKVDNIQALNKALKTKGNKPYNSNMHGVKIEN